MTTDPTPLTTEELDAIERATFARSPEELVSDATILQSILARHRPKPALPEVLWVEVSMDDTGEPCVACHYDKAAAGDAHVYPIYPNPDLMMDPETLAVDYAITIELSRQNLSGDIHNTFVLRDSRNGDYIRNMLGHVATYPLTRDGYRSALREATEIARQQAKGSDDA